MSKKIIISKKQLMLIKEHINDVEPLDEGFKDIALGLLMLAGATLSGQNKAIAQTALGNDEIIQKIDATLNDDTKLEKVINKINSKMPEAGELIQRNADKIKSTIKYIEDKNSGNKKKVGQTTNKSKTTNPRVLRDKLNQGYALTNVTITNDTILPQKSIVTVHDTIDFKWSSDNFFQSGSFELNQNSSDSIQTVVSEIKNNGGRVVGVFIESSTDKEPIKMGNEKLAKLRASSVGQFTKSLGLGDVNYKVVTKPNSGPDLFNKKLTNEDRLSARLKTSEFRYVNIKLIVVFDVEVEGEETAPQVIERHQYELVKINTLIYNKVKTHYKHKKSKTSCKKIKTTNKKGKVKSIPCELFK